MTWEQMKELTEVDLTPEYNSEYARQFKTGINTAASAIAQENSEEEEGDMERNEEDLEESDDENLSAEYGDDEDDDDDDDDEEEDDEDGDNENSMESQSSSNQGSGDDEVEEPVDQRLLDITAEDVGDHLYDFHGFKEQEMADKIAGVVDEAEDEMPVYYHEEMLNYNLPWRKSIEFEDRSLDQFVPDDHEEKFRFDYRGYRACSGKRQRRGLNTQLSCHKIDLAELSYLDVITLQRFLTHDSEILPRSESGLCQKCQRKVAKTVKRARHLGILPHIGEFIVRDSRPLSEGTTFQDSVQKNKRPVQSRTVLK